MVCWIMKTNKSQTLAEQDQALSLYMDSLLGVSTGSSLVEQSKNNNDESKISPIESKKILSQRNEANQAERKINQQTHSQFNSIKLTVENSEASINSNNHVVFENKKTQSIIDQSPAAEQSTAEQSTAEPFIVEQDEAPRLDLSLFLPKIPTPEELDIIEKKEQGQINFQLQKELEKSKQVNILLKGQLEESLKKLDDYGKTHTEVYAPDWAHPSFQVILFNVGNLKLALPLNDLNSIVVWDDKYINQMPGSAQWYLGLIQHQGKSVPVIDTLQQVVPPERIESFIKKRSEFKNIIIINDASWGLVCEEVIGIKTLSAEDVKWRSNRTSRRWLYGTVKEHMCALLDTDEFASMLRTGEDSLISGKTK